MYQPQLITHWKILHLPYERLTPLGIIEAQFGDLPETPRCCNIAMNGEGLQGPASRTGSQRKRISDSCFKWNNSDFIYNFQIDSENWKYNRIWFNLLRIRNRFACESFGVPNLDLKGPMFSLRKVIYYLYIGSYILLINRLVYITYI